MSELQKAYVLHLRNFTDSRVIVEWLTQVDGRIATVSRTPSRRSRACFQQFQTNAISFKGGKDLKTLVVNEVDGGGLFHLVDKALLCGFYLNELLLRMLPLEDPVPEIFLYYQRCLHSLSHSLSLTQAESALRHFEFDCLDALGLGLNFSYAYDTDQPIEEGSTYRLVTLSGFKKESFTGSYERKALLAQGFFLGKDLLAIGARDFEVEGVLFASKKISRILIKSIIGARPLKSRELFV